ncbi:plasmid mobilization protein [Dinoroseobacter sp. S76]|uniref:plasmid mobilization protein n=1 Tax=Dinoroseobacter sp. S76 TaxID=3415124 RepID=UPI003C7A379A
MARPKIDPALRRTAQVNVGLSPTELATIKAKADRAGTNVTAFIRASAVGKTVTVQETTGPGFEDRQELRRIGVNLNQIAKALNARQEALPASLIECCEKLDRIFDVWLANDAQGITRNKL